LAAARCEAAERLLPGKVNDQPNRKWRHWRRRYSRTSCSVKTQCRRRQHVPGADYLETAIVRSKRSPVRHRPVEAVTRDNQYRRCIRMTRHAKKVRRQITVVLIRLHEAHGEDNRTHLILAPYRLAVSLASKQRNGDNEKNSNYPSFHNAHKPPNLILKWKSSVLLSSRMPCYLIV
jgi:hypothetical protein